MEIKKVKTKKKNGKKKDNRVFYMEIKWMGNEGKI
jgi:hypothetical protein